MRSMSRPRLAASTILSVLVAFAFWSGASLTAAQKKSSSKTTTSARPAASVPKMPMLRALSPGRRVQGEGGQDEFDRRSRFSGQLDESRRRREPREHRMIRARSFNGDLRSLPQTPDAMLERTEREGPRPSPSFLGDPNIDPVDTTPPPAPGVIEGAAPAPPPTSAFDGLDFNGFGNGFPPDTNGDVGPEYYIQSINTALGIFRKSTGERVAAFGFNTFMSQGQFGNLCDSNNFGDPVILYDTFEDRWVVTDFAFRLVAGAVVSPPGAFQCMAVSKTSDPVSGGWNFYSTNFNTGLNDYPKFGVWPDGIYMSANMFGFPAGGGFQGVKVYAFNKAQMYAGEESMQIVSFDIAGGDFTILPSNARLQAGTPPPGTPNYFVSTWLFLNALTVYKFHVDWDHIGLSTLTGPDVPITPTGWPNAGVPNAPSLGGNSLDVLQIRAMMQNQYTNIGGAESLWATHTVRRQNVTGFAAPRWYQLNVTGGTVAPTSVQAATWDPDGANVMHRFMPSLAIDRAGNMAIGYSTSSATTKPAIKYAGRLAGDPINTFSLTEQTMVQGTGTQTGNCGGSVCTRWGDYATMTLDVDGCTFWYTNEYYKEDGRNYQTHIGSFSFPSCTPVGQGTLQGTVRSAATSAPIVGATVSLGSRTATTDGSGVYSFSNLPAGTYPSVSASNAGFNTASATSIVVNELSTTVRDFSLTTAASAGCLTDTTFLDFNAGVATNCDLTGASGTVTLVNPEAINQQNNTFINSGFGFTTTGWAGQTFVPSATGVVTRIDVNLFCAGCSGVPRDITLSVRATDPVSLLPTGPDLGTATIAGFLSGAANFRTAIFATPVALTGGTRYAFVIRPVINPTGTYAYVVSASDVYANGSRVISGVAGVTWLADPARDLGGR